MKKISRTIGGIMLAIAICFIIFVLKHPEGAFPWHNAITYTIYGIYTLVMIVLFIAPFKSKHK